jgi:hypothetical protein
MPASKNLHSAVSPRTVASQPVYPRKLTTWCNAPVGSLGYGLSRSEDFGVSPHTSLAGRLPTLYELSSYLTRFAHLNNSFCGAL